MHHILYLSGFSHRYVDPMISVSRSFPSPTCTFAARLTLWLFSGSWGPFYFRINKQLWWEQLNSWKNRLRRAIGSAHAPQSWLVAENHAHLAWGREWPLWKVVLCSYSFILRQSRPAQLCSPKRRIVQKLHLFIPFLGRNKHRISLSIFFIVKINILFKYMIKE